LPGLAVSVVIPTYNRAGVLARALACALAQVRPGDEILVVDDGSTDGTRVLLAGYDAPVRTITTANGGAGAARNVGILAARNPLVAFLDSDDAWMPGSLEARRRVLEARPDVLYCFSDFAISLPDGRAIHHYLPRWHADPRPWEAILGPGVALRDLAGPETPLGDALVHVGDLYLCEMRANYVLTSSWIVRREAAGDALRFEPGLPNGEDWVAFGRVAGRGPGAYLDAETAWQHGDSTGRISTANELSMASGRVRVLELVWGGDARFQQDHRGAYDLELEAARLRLARALLAAGRPREARELLRLVPGAPRAFRWLAAMPGPFLGAALGVRRLVRHVGGAERRARMAWDEAVVHESHTAHVGR